LVRLVSWLNKASIVGIALQFAIGPSLAQAMQVRINITPSSDILLQRRGTLIFKDELEPP
jgi:hypothetical protein